MASSLAFGVEEEAEFHREGQLACEWLRVPAAVSDIFLVFIFRRWEVALPAPDRALSRFRPEKQILIGRCVVLARQGPGTVAQDGCLRVGMNERSREIRSAEFRNRELCDSSDKDSASCWRVSA